MQRLIPLLVIKCLPSIFLAQSVFLEDISWTVAREKLNAESLVVIPLGAGAKEHGPHLPLSTDKIQADGLAGIVSKKVNAVFTPTVSYGYYPAFIKYPGSTTTYWHTSRDMIVEIIKTLACLLYTSRCV